MKISKKEKRRLEDDTSFIFKNIEDTSVRLVSRSTLDSWIIDLKDTYCILYHDHPGQKRYHEHRRFRSISEAIREIKGHDKYVLEQKKSLSNRIGRYH